MVIKIKTLCALMLFLFSINSLMSQSDVFSYTGGAQTFTVPDCVTEVTVTVDGAGGGGGGKDCFFSDADGGDGGSGGRVVTIFTVTPGEVLGVIVGGGGGLAETAVEGAGGYGGGTYEGGTGSDVSSSGGGGGGGAASAVSRGGTALAVGAGGGGGGGGGKYSTKNGGAGGDSGANGTTATGAGGTAGGSGSGVGGSGTNGGDEGGGGGGGGGLNGGSAGSPAGSDRGGGGGGGGDSYADAGNTSTTITEGGGSANGAGQICDGADATNGSNGSVTIAYTLTTIYITTLASNNPATAAATHCASSTNNEIYSFTLALDGGTGTRDFSQVDFTTTGDFDTGDIDNYQLWYNTSDNLGSATAINTIGSPGAATTAESFSGFTQTLNASATSYFWITVDVNASPTNAHSLTIVAIDTDDITMAAGGCKKGSTSAGGQQTISTAVVAATLDAAGSNIILNTDVLTLAGAGVGGSATGGTWSITSSSPAAGGSHTLSDATFTTTPDAVTFTPYGGYSGTVILTLSSDGCGASTDTRVIYVIDVATYTSDDTWTAPCIPATVSVQCWGAGGGGGGAHATNGGGTGGAGGYVSSEITTTASEVFDLYIGSGGGGGGGATTNTYDCGHGGGGGGRSYFEEQVGPVLVLIAGGGGGGGGGDNSASGSGAGGGGGGTTGVTGGSASAGTTGGGGGTNAGGGAAGASGANAGAAGASLTGGAGGNSGAGGDGTGGQANGGTYGGANGGDQKENSYGAGGGGGGGYYGGGGGGASTASEAGGGGGGGGSNYLTGASQVNSQGSGITPPSTGDGNYVAGKGDGGAAGTSGGDGTDGGNGLVAVTISALTHPTANAGNDQTMCEGVATGIGSAVDGTVAVTNNTSLTWATTDGTGTFVNATDISSATYEPSAYDASIGTVTIVLTSITSCDNVADVKTITVPGTKTWDGGGGDDNLTTAANWSTNVAPIADDILIFSGSTKTTPTNDYAAATDFSSIQFANGASSFTLSGNAIDITGTCASTNAILASNASNTMTIQTNITMTATNTITSTSGGTLVISGTIDNGGFNTTAVTGGTTTLSGVISGTGSLTKTGSGALTLSATNTLTGGVTLSAGTLNIDDAQALGTSAGTFTIADGTTIDASLGAVDMSATDNPIAWNGDVTFTGTNNLDLGEGAVTIGANRQITASANTLTIGGVIGGGAYSVTKTGSGALTLSGTNTFTGGVTLSGGTLNIENAQALGTSAGTFIIADGTTIDASLGATDMSATDNPITWSGSFTFTGTNNLDLGDGTITMAASRTVTTSGSALTVGGVLSSAANDLTSAGGGGLSFDAQAVTLNDINITAGTLTSTSGNLSIAGDFDNDATFTHNSGTVTFNGTVDQNLGTSAGSQTFYDVIINNTGASGSDDIILADPVTVTNTVTLTDGIINTDATNLLTLSNTATGAISGGSAGTFVNGPLSWDLTTGTTYTFPVGTGSSTWMRLGLSALTGSTNFTVEYSDADYGDATVTGTLNNASQTEYWDVTEVNAAVDADVTLYWENATTSDINSCAAAGDLVVAHFNGTQWEDLGNAGGVTGTCAGGDDGTVKATGVTSFSPFSFGSQSGGLNPLPIELLSFTTTYNGTAVDLSWETASEINNDYFTIERATDAVNFEIIEDFIPSKAENGKSTTLLSYATTDDNRNSGTYYYRLKQTDFDGQYEYSNVVPITITQNNVEIFDFNISPNPSDGINISGFITAKENSNIEIKLYDLIGQFIYANEIITDANENNMFTIYLPQPISKGVYILSATKGTEVINKRIVVE